MISKEDFDFTTFPSTVLRDELFLLNLLRSGDRLESLSHLKHLFGSEEMENESANAVTIDFGTAAMLCAIEAIERSKSPEPMTPEAEAEAVERMDALRRKARAARADHNLS